MTGSVTLFYTYERGTRSKLLQFLGGLPPVVYWLAGLIYDQALFLVTVLAVFLIHLTFSGPEVAVYGDSSGPRYLLIVLFG